MAKYPKMQPLTLSQQFYGLKSTYRNILSCGIIREVLTCIMEIKPSENSDTYQVKIRYQLGHPPRIWLLDPLMQQRNGEYPKHLYLQNADAAGHQCLCLYYPGYNEWHGNKLLSTTIVPWISAWLNTYEYWLITGEWQYPESPHGGVK